MMLQRPIMREEKAIVLDFLPNGYPIDSRPMHMRLPVMQAIGKSHLEHSLKLLVMEHEARFVDFFNKAMPVNTRFHQIELLPGIGKKHMWEILEARKEPFKSFADIKQRVKLIPDPEKSIAKRILEELSGTEKHMLFV